MKIDRNTLYKDFAAVEPYVSAEELAKLRDAAVRDRYGDNGFYDMKLGDFLDASMHGDFSSMFDKGGETVVDVYRVAAFSQWVNEFIAAAERLTLKPTPKQIRLSQGCLSVTFEESVYYLCRRYFGLANFDAVRQLSVSDYLMAKKDEYNKAVIDRNTANSLKKN